jgi:YD repeat-containing protein
MGLVKAGGPQGTFIEVQFDNFCTICTGYCLPYPTPDPDDNTDDDDDDPDDDDSECDNSIIGFREGHLWETISLPGFREFGRTFGLTLSYYSGGANPTATISAQVNYNSTRPVERTIFEFQVEGLTVEGVYDFSDNNRKPYGTYIWDGVNALGTQLPTGSYPYSILVTSLNSDVAVSIPSLFGGSAVQQFGVKYPGLAELPGEEITGRVAILNLRDSEYGAGWRIQEEDRLYFDSDGCIMLVSGSSSWKRFVPDPSDATVWISPAGDFSTLLQNPGNGSFIRRLPDGGEDVFNSLGRITSSVDRYGATTTFDHQGNLLTKVTSPTGYFYELFYDGSDTLARIDDSAGRSTLFMVDGNGDLVTILDAASSLRTFEYDPNHLLTAQNQPRGERSEYSYMHGRVVTTYAYDVDGTSLLRQRFFAPSAL